jgi:homoserine kinase type II
MAVYTLLSPEALADAAARFGLPPPERSRPEPRGHVNTSYHLWAGGHRFFLRVNEGRVGAKGLADTCFEAEVQRFLFEARFPVPELLAAADGRPFAEVAGKPALLFAYAPGEPTGEPSPDRCFLVGEQLGRLHALAEGFGGGRENPYGPARVEAWLAPLRGHPPAGGGENARDASAAALPLLEEALAEARHLPGAPRGLVHGDLFPDNVLWIGERISALLDWEMSCVEAFAYDLGVALCAWAWADGFQLGRARALLAGYRARRRLDADTALALPAWARYAALRFTASRLRAALEPELSPDRVVRKDWREFRDRLVGLRELGDAGLRELAGV